MKIYVLRQSWPNVVDKLTKLSEIGFSIKCFTAGFWQRSSSIAKICLSGDWLCTRHQTVDLVTFTEEILSEKRHFFCSDLC